MAGEEEGKVELAQGSMSLFQHLDELRKRVIWSVLSIIIFTAAAFTFIETLFRFLILPFYKALPKGSTATLANLGMEHQFVVYLKLALLVGVFASAPVILWQVWAFVSPGLYERERRWAGPFIIFGTVFFIAGGVCGYLGLPYLLTFFMNFGSDMVTDQWSLQLYFGRVMQMILVGAIVFEQPLIMWVLSAAGVLSPQLLAKGRAYWVVAALALAAVFTPPDPASQIAVGVLMMIFYEMGVIGSRVLYPANRRAEAEADEDEF